MKTPSIRTAIRPGQWVPIDRWFATVEFLQDQNVISDGRDYLTPTQRRRLARLPHRSTPVGDA